MYQKMIKPLMHSTYDMKTYLKNGKTKKRYVYYSGNWVPLNTVGSLILFLPHPPKEKKKTMDLEFSETVKLLSELFRPNTSLFHKRWKCLNIFKDGQQDYLTFATIVSKHCNDFKLADLTADDFKCLIFTPSLVSTEDAEIRRRVLIKLENEQGLILTKLAEDCQRVVSVKSESKTIEESGVAHIKKIKSKPTRYSPQKEKRKIVRPNIYDKQSTHRQKKSTTRTMLYLW